MNWRTVRRGGDEAAPQPLALFERANNADRIAASCEGARAAGLGAGSSLAEARARFPRFDFRPRELAAETKLLEAVADWCDRYTPLVATNGADGLVLDIAGCAHLFGGERALVDDLLARLFALGFAASAAVSDHAGTARALVAGRAAAAPVFVAAGAEAEAVSPLPVEALRLEPDLAGTLRRLGLKHVGDLLAQPREALARRFGETLLGELDAATGRRRRPIRPRLCVPPLMAERRFAEPLVLQEDVERVLLFLAARLEADLARREQGGRRFELKLFRVDGRVERIAVGAGQPCRSPETVARLFREHFAGLGRDLDAGFGYDLIRLCIPVAAPLVECQQDLAPGGNADPNGLAGLLDRLAARLGEVSVCAPEPVESHWPERAARPRPATAGAPPGAASPAGGSENGPPRPARLLARPEPVAVTQGLPDGPPANFRWRRALHVVRRFEGPERIAPEWWREDAQGVSARDYYRIEDESGRRYWLFRQGENQGAAPNWFVHGLFA